MKLLSRVLLTALIAGLCLMSVGQVAAQTFTTLHNFSATSNYDNNDGTVPYGGVILSGNILYGTAEYGGGSGLGTVFAVHTDGTGFTNLHAFTAGGNDNSSTYATTYTNSDGIYPMAGLVLSGSILYGTTSQGGGSGLGTVFAVHTDGTGFTNLHIFPALLYPDGTNSDGASPEAGLILSGNTLYGTAYYGGAEGDNGTIFSVHTDGTGFTNLHSFRYIDDGARPQAGLILSGNTLYGTTSVGGLWDSGTVFAVHTDGTGFTKLYTFTLMSNLTNSDGFHPAAGLIVSGNTLYGTTTQGGESGGGTVFAVHTDGTDFTMLNSFSNGSGGANPSAGLILSGNTLYGTASQGGDWGVGTVFAVNTNGTGFVTLHGFSSVGYDSAANRYTNGDGTAPVSSLILSGNTLYGTASYGGSAGNGTVFSVHAPDTTPPIVTLDSISPDQIITNNILPGIFGAASDPETGIYAVYVYLERATNSGFVYWNGSNWQDNATWSTATYNATNKTWTVNIPLPSGGNLINADYEILVNALNNESPYALSLQYVHFTVDFHPAFVFNYGSQFTLTPSMNWSDPNNWDVGSVPTTDGVVYINAPYTPDSTSLGTVQVYGLNMSGGSLVTSGLLVSRLNLSGGALTGGVISLTSNAVFNWSGGTLSGSYNVPLDATFNLTGSADKTLLGAIINNNGTVNWSGGNLVAWSGTAINNNDAFIIQSNGIFSSATSYPPYPTFNNNSWLQKTIANGITTFSSENNGWVCNQNGTMAIENGVLSMQSQFNVTDGAAFAGPGKTRVDAGYLIMSGTSTIRQEATLELAAGVWNGTQLLTGPGTMVWSGGNIAGISTIDAGTHLSILGNAPTKILTGKLVNAGTGVWTGTGSINCLSGSVFQNDGTFTVQNDSSFFSSTSSTPYPAFINNGSLIKTNSSNTTFFDSTNNGVSFNNNGSINVQSGSLILGGGGADAGGSFTAASGSMIDLTGGSHIFSGVNSFNGPGLTRLLTAGTLVLSGDVAFNNGGRFEVADGGTVNGTGTFGGTGTFNWTGGVILGLITLQTNLTCTLAGAGDKTLLGGIINNNGSVIWSAGNLVASTGSAINNNGSFIIQSNGLISSATSSFPYPVFNNNGRLQKTNANGVTTFSSDNIGWICNQNGTMDIENGILSMQSQFNVTDGSIFAGPGKTRVDAGSLIMSGTSTIQQGATLELAAGVWNGTQLLTGPGTMIWSGGNILGIGTIDAGTHLSIQGNSPTKILTGKLVNIGSGVWTGTGSINCVSGSIFQNDGTFTVQNDTSFFSSSSSFPYPAFINNGTLRKNTTTGTTTFAPDNGGVNFNNNGTVDLQTGTLALAGYALSGSPRLNLALGGASPGTQFSRETFAGSTTLGGILSVTLTNGFIPTNGQSFTIITCGFESGQFTTRQLPPLPNNLSWQIIYGDTAVTLTVVISTLISHPTLLANGHLQFSLSGPSTGSAIIQASTNMIDWLPLQTNTPFTGLLLFEDAQTTAYPFRFYQVLMQP